MRWRTAAKVLKERVADDDVEGDNVAQQRSGCAESDVNHCARADNKAMVARPQLACAGTGTCLESLSSCGALSTTGLMAHRRNTSQARAISRSDLSLKATEGSSTNVAD